MSFFSFFRFDDNENKKRRGYFLILILFPNYALLLTSHKNMARSTLTVTLFEKKKHYQMLRN